MASLAQENTACLRSRPLISSNQTMARWPSPRPIPNLLRIWHKANLRLITTKHDWELWLILTPSTIKHRLRRRPDETARSPGRRPSSSPPSQTRQSPPDHSYSRSTPLNRCGRSQRFASRPRKTTRYHRTRSCISRCPRRSERRGFVRRRNRFDRPWWNGVLLMESRCSGSDDRIRSWPWTSCSTSPPLGPVASLSPP